MRRLQQHAVTTGELSGATVNGRSPRSVSPRRRARSQLGGVPDGVTRAREIGPVFT